ncbi:hypothetical protein K449DRAFT_465263 [Hypoxylon sp. EC38]|nr:hypothetical protein K449DRAFT_465263 [Hypoxylon sp. EC38]
MLEVFFPPDALYRYKDRETPAPFQKGDKQKAFDIQLDGDSRAQIVFPRPLGNFEPPAPLKFSKPTKNPRHSVSGWYVRGCNLAEEQWNSMRCVTEDETQRRLEKSKLYKGYNHLPFRLERQVNGIDALWAVRAYFVGQNTANAPPYVVVLCSELEVSRWLVDDVSRQLSENYENWYATRLPNVEVLKYGSENGHSDLEESEAAETDENVFEVIKVDLNETGPAMLNEPLPSWTEKRHSCGMRLEVVRDSGNPIRGTIGGVISIGGTLYGLAVGHIFFHQTQNIIAEDTTPHITVATGHTQTGIPTILEGWQQRGRYSASLDWALVSLPGLQGLGANTWGDMNLVQTVGGDFRPVLFATNEPLFGTPVIMATPGSTYGLRGVFVSSEAVVNILGTDAPYAVWVLRMEAPWLIRKGDSGSWAFDAITGNLLGILVAGCPNLLEAYILPAFRVFDEIRGRNGTSVIIPYNHLVLEDAYPELSDLLKRYQELKIQRDVIKASEKYPTIAQEEFKQQVIEWSHKKESLSSSCNQLRSYYFNNLRTSHWIHPQNIILHRENWIKQTISKNTSHLSKLDFLKLTSWAVTAVRQSRLKCYNSMNEKLRDLLRSPSKSISYSEQWVMLNAVQDYLILGEHEEFPQSYERFVNFLNISDRMSVIGKEAEISLIHMRMTPETEFLSARPWDRYLLTDILHFMEIDLQAVITATASDSWLEGATQQRALDRLPSDFYNLLQDRTISFTKLSQARMSGERSCSNSKGLPVVMRSFKDLEGSELQSL